MFRGRHHSGLSALVACGPPPLLTSARSCSICRTQASVETLPGIDTTVEERLCGVGSYPVEIEGVPDVALLAVSSNRREALMASSMPPVPSSHARAASLHRSLASHTLGSTPMRVLSSMEAARSTRRQASLHRGLSHRFMPQAPRQPPANASSCSRPHHPPPDPDQLP